MIHYLLQILAFQLLFLIVYDLFLRKETFFNWNRVYLLLTPIVSFVLPLIKIKTIQQNVPEEYVIHLPEILITGNTSEILANSPDSWFQSFNITQPLFYIWSVGILISTFIFCSKIYRVRQLKKSGIKTRFENINLISLPNTNEAFSFFNTIFLGKELSETKKTNILLHEKIHINQYHSIDLLFFEMLRILFWFNPLTYVFQNRIVMLQEYIADAKVIEEINKKQYYQDLLSQTFQTKNVSFINTFFNHSLIKNRILMLQKSKSKTISKIKYLLLIPIVTSMLTYTSCNHDLKENLEQQTVYLETKKIQEAALKGRIKFAEKSASKMNPDQQNRLKKIVGAYKTNGTISKKQEEELNELVKSTYKDNKRTYHPELMSFKEIQIAPTTLSCKDIANNEERKGCFSREITKFVNEEFNTDIALEEKLIGNLRIYVRFKIDKNGKIQDAQARAPLPVLEEEALRVVKLLPDFTPGEHNGEKVGVVYALPIVFQLTE